MADKKGPKKPPEDPRKQKPEDMDKTVLDIDIRNLKDLKDEFEEGFEETVMVRVPSSKEDLDATEEDFFDKEDDTGDHVLPEASPPVKKSKVAPKKEEKLSVPPAEKAKGKEAPASQVPTPVSRVTDEGSYTVMSQLPRVKPNLSLAFLALSLILMLALAEALVEVLTRGPGLRFPAILFAALGAVSLVGILLRRWEGKTGFLWLTVAFFGLVSYSGFNFLTSDPESLHLVKFPLNVLLSPILLLVGAIIVLTLVGKKRVPFLCKLLALLALLILVVNLAFNVLGHQTLETGLWGAGFLRKLPLLVRPGILSLWLAFPLFFVATAVATLLTKPSTRGKFRNLGIPLILISLMGAFLGLRLLARQGVEVPLISKLFPLKYFGTTIVDPLAAAAKLEIFHSQSFQTKDDLFRLEVAASRSKAKGNGREAFLMVKNVEGNYFARNLGDDLSLSRGDKKVKSVTSSLIPERLGVPRDLTLLIDLPSVVKTQNKTALLSAIMELGQRLSPSDRLNLGSAGGTQTLKIEDQDKWEGTINKLLVPDRVDAPAVMGSFLKKEAPTGALREVIYLGEGGSFPTQEQSQAMLADAAKAKATMSFVSLGKLNAEDDSTYVALEPSALGFELLSAASETLGQYNLQFPNLPPLPKISITKNEQGQVDLVGGKFDFGISAQDPSLIASLQIKMDEEAPLTLDPAQAQQSVDLLKFKIKPGLHRVEVSMTTTSGDVVSESVEVNYVTRRALRFVKPMDKDTVSGNYGVMVSPGRVQGLNTTSVEFFIDGNKIGSATAEPMLFNVETASLSEGEHTLQAVQTYSDGTNETVQEQVRANQQVPQIKIAHPSIGEYLPNLADIEAQIGGGLFEQIQKVEFLVDGEWIGESLQAPYRFLWSNNGFPAGVYYIQARAIYASQATTTDAVQVQLAQGEVVVQADPSLSQTGMLFPDNVEVLLDASAGMNGAIGESIKLDLAKYALSELIQSLPESVHFNARVYGGESYSSQRNCADSTLLKKPGSQIPEIEARGTSPLAYNLKMLEQDLKKSQGSRVALLIADGWDRCGQDPLEIASALAKQSDKLRLHVIYFSDVDPASESLLKKLAEVMGGRIYRVSREEEFAKAIREAMQVSFALYDFKNVAVVNQPLSQTPFTVRAGDYRLEIDTMPPIVKEKVVIPTGARKNFTIMNNEGKYELKDE